MTDQPTSYPADQTSRTPHITDRDNIGHWRRKLETYEPANLTDASPNTVDGIAYPQQQPSKYHGFKVSLITGGILVVIAYIAFYVGWVLWNNGSRWMAMYSAAVGAFAVMSAGWVLTSAIYDMRKHNELDNQ